MAKSVLTNVYLAINGSTIHTLNVLAKAELDVQIADVETTNFGSGGAQEYTGGLMSGTLNLSFMQDLVASQIDAVIWPLFIAKTPVTFEWRLTTSAVGTSNPKYTGNVLINQWGITGSVGDLATIDVGWPVSGVTTRATA
jgi:hypothetical protein